MKKINQILIISFFILSVIIFYSQYKTTVYQIFEVSESQQKERCENKKQETIKWIFETATKQKWLYVVSTMDIDQKIMEIKETKFKWQWIRNWEVIIKNRFIVYWTCLWDLCVAEKLDKPYCEEYLILWEGEFIESK